MENDIYITFNTVELAFDRLDLVQEVGLEDLI